MFRLNDLILLLVIFVSMLAGILLPGFGSPFQPYVLYLMMSLLFLSFLSIQIDTIWHTLRDSAWSIVLLFLIKTIALPIAVYSLFRYLYPSYAIAALLLSGISTGVVAPFISNLVQAHSALVLVMVVVTSLFVPFSLPIIVKVLAGHTIEISLFAMIRMLSLVIFVPILAVEALRRLSPALTEEIKKRQFPVSLVIFSLINLGVFSRYSNFFFQSPSTILIAVLVAIALFALYHFIGFVSLVTASVEMKMTAGISMANMNNVLIIVFASQFFGPLEATLAAMYMVPFFGSIPLLKIFHAWHQRRMHGSGSS